MFASRRRGWPGEARTEAFLDGPLDTPGIGVHLRGQRECESGRKNEEKKRRDREAKKRKRGVQAADSVLKLVSELKQTAIFSGFASLNENVDRRIEVFNQQAESTERLLEKIGEEAAASLKELETHYYSSVLRTC
ncbi:hypothetical protein COCNU_02G006090 [Cocos nucifera]|uniref:Uncharacterized protein n=1 Tax=Cocos nucifera TaxID=13894 RepID=A0A8K0HYJ1_COCNU|nr:hypothetical protein COCNU_02G006090 [Cocos nucifera]